MTPARRTIGFVTRAIAWGGAEVHTQALADVLAGRGWRVVLFQVGHAFYSSADASRNPGITIVELPAAAPNVVGWTQLFRQFRIDTVVLVKSDFNLWWPSLDVAMWVSRRRYVAIGHTYPNEPLVRSSRRHFGGTVPGIGLWYYRTRAKQQLHRVAIAQTIAVARAIKRQLVDRYGYSADRVTVVANGVDGLLFRPDAAMRAAARQRWQVPADAFVFGTVSRLSELKRIDRVLCAFNGLLAEAPHQSVYLVIVGAGPEAVPLGALAQELGCGARVVWAGETRAAASAYPGFDAFVLASETEGMPYALLEAMACERVPVVMDVGGVGEVVHDGVTGRLVGQVTAEFQQAMLDVLTMPAAHRDAIGHAARDHVLRHHDQRILVAAAAEVVVPGFAAAGSP